MNVVCACVMCVYVHHCNNKIADYLLVNTDVRIHTSKAVLNLLKH